MQYHFPVLCCSAILGLLTTVQAFVHNSSSGLQLHISISNASFHKPNQRCFVWIDLIPFFQSFWSVLTPYNLQCWTLKLIFWKEVGGSYFDRIGSNSVHLKKGFIENQYFNRRSTKRVSKQFELKKDEQKITVRLTKMFVR